MAGEFQFEMVFTADTSAVKPATEAVKSELSSVGNAANQTTDALGKHTTALERDAAAAKKAAEASRQQAQAEREARDQLARTLNAPPPASPQSAPAISPLRQPSAPVPAPAQPASNPGTSPQDLEKLKTTYMPLYSAQRNYQTTLADLDTLQKNNAISAQEHAFALAKAQKTFDQETESAKRASSALLGHSNAVKLSSFEMKNLGFQANDTVQSLALGMPPLQVLMQQGPQAVQAVGGVGNSLRLVGQVATGANIALAGTAAIVVGGAAAWSSYLNSIKPVEVATAGLGRAVAGTAADMERSAQAGASTAGITVKAARSMEVQFLSTGRIGSENFTKLIGVSKDFATTIGINSDQAGAALAQLFTDPAKAAQTLYHQYGLIDGATADYATRLASQNRVSEAQNVILDALPERLAKAAQATTLLGRAWQGVSSGASNAYDWIGRNIDAAVNGPSLEEQVSQAQAKYQKLAKAQQERSWWNRPGEGQVSRAKEAVDTLGPQLRRQQEQAALARARAQAEQDGANAVAIAQQSPANAELQQRQALGDSLEALKKGANAPGLSADQQNQINETIRARTTLLGNLTDKQARLNEISRLEVQIQAARDPATRAELTYRQQILQLGLQEINQGNAEAQALRARNEIIQSAIATAGSQAADMQAELELRKQLNAQVVAGTMTADQAQAKLQEELQLRPLIAAADKEEGETKRQLLDVINRLKTAYGGLAAEQQRMAAINIATQSPANASREQEKSLRQQIRQLKEAIAQGDNDPQTTAAQTAALTEKERLLDALSTKQQTLNEIDALGVRIQSEMNPAIQAELAARQRRLQLSLQEGNAAERNAEVERARNAIIDSTMAGAARQASDMAAEVGIRQKLNAQVAAGNITSDDAQRKLQEELQLRPLIAAAATLEGEKKRELLKIIEELRSGYAGLNAAEKEASANDYIRGQQDKLETLRAQQAVVGESEATQARVNALLQAEQDIRSRGLDAASQQAQIIRKNAAAIADANTQLEKSKDAWNTYKQAGESAIDTLFSGDKPGDIGKKLANTFLDLGKQLIVTNPLKNMLLGTNYGTIEDLFSGKKSSGGILGGLGQSVASMNVNAATVMINGGVAGGLDLFGKSSDTTGSITKLLNPANNNASAPTGSIASYITQAALKRNIDPSIALAVAKSEGGLSSWNLQSSYMKNGIREPSFGPYQLYMNGGLGNAFMSKTGLDPRMAANGPAGVDFALDYASKNGWGSWYGAAKSGIGNWDGIGKVNSSLNQLSGSISSASSGVGGLTSASGAAANGLTSLGGGLDQFGGKLANSLNGLGSGGSGGGGGGLFGWIGKLFGGGGGGGFNIGSGATPVTGFDPLQAYANAGFDSGGFTGEGGKFEPAGVVHKGEFVFDAAATARAGVSTLDRLHRTLKGYSDGGAVGRSVFSAPGPEPLQRSAAANSNAPGGAALTKMDVTLNVAGADSKDSEAAGYAGMRRALAEYDRALPDRVQGINRDPRWRT